MKKFLGFLLILFGFWVAGATVVHADVKPLPPDYDPIQGGTVLRPPSDLWVQVNSATLSIIPLAYLPPGPLNPAQLSQLSYQVQVNNGAKNAVSSVPSFANTNVNPTLKLGFGASVNNRLGIAVKASQIGDYALKLFMRFGQSADEYEVEIQLHVVASLSPIVGVNISSKPIFSPLPQLALWQHRDGEVSVETSPTISSTQLNDLKWPLSPIFSFLPNTTTGASDGAIVVRTLPYVFKVSAMSVTESFGLNPVTVYEGKPLTINVEYIQPQPGTSLSFIWSFNKNKTVPDRKIRTQTLTLPAGVVQPDDLNLELTLEYSDGQTTALYRSEMVPIKYVPTPIQTLPPAQATLSIADLLQGPATVNAGWSDWPVTAQGNWHLNIAMTPLQQADGTTLAASLVGPDALKVTPEMPATLDFTGDQVVPLSQLNWVFQQQPAVVAGHYQAQITFQAIAGP